MASSPVDKMSIVEYFGGDGGHHCGYCDSSAGFVAPGMWAHSLTVQDLQELTDLGWRRSGKYCYKPSNSEMCCPLYIIRCDAPNFVISKSQKKVLKKMASFLKEGHKEKNNLSLEETTPPKTDEKPSSQEKLDTSSKVLEEATPSEETKITEPGISTDSMPLEQATPTQGSKESSVRPGLGPDPNKPKARKAKDIRRERKLQKTGDQSKLTTPIPATQERKSLEEYFEEVWSVKDPAHKLTIRLVQSHPPSKEFRDTLQESYQVYRKYQMNIHKDPPNKCAFANYKRFLVDSPLEHIPGPPEWECGYGSYHQQYFLDGKLIMVGVIDILPNCLSSKYLYYDTDYDFLKLGVFSALNETALVRKLHTHNSSFRYYCMGYYVHTCQKMKYKGEYSPCYLLCPVTNKYVPIEVCRPKLDVAKYSRLNEEACPLVSSGEAESCLVLYRHQAMPFSVLRVIEGDEVVRVYEDKVKEYTSLVGPVVSQRCLLFLA